MWETWVRSLGWKDPLEKGKAAHSGLENPRDGGAWWAAVYVVAQSGTRLKRLSTTSSSSNVGDPGSIPGLGRSPGEGEGYPFQ